MTQGQQFTHTIIPGILEKEWSEIEKKATLLKGSANTLHIDFIDGKFADNRTFFEFEPFRILSSDFFLEAHLMVEDPAQYLKPLADAGFKRFIGHIEHMKDQASFVADGLFLGEVGLAVDGKSPLEKITVDLEELDLLVIMTINAGFSGQTFDPDQLKKIETVRTQHPFLPIEVDGGINDVTIEYAKKAGGNYFIANSFLFKDNPQKQYQLLMQKITS